MSLTINRLTIQWALQRGLGFAKVCSRNTVGLDFYFTLFLTLYFDVILVTSWINVLFSFPVVNGKLNMILLSSNKIVSLPSPAI